MKNIIKEIIKAIKNNDADTLSFLFYKNKTLGNLRLNIDGDNPLIFAFKYKSKDCISFLLTRSDLSIKNHLGEAYSSFIDTESERESIKIKSILEIHKDKKQLAPFVKSSKQEVLKI